MEYIKNAEQKHLDLAYTIQQKKYTIYLFKENEDREYIQVHHDLMCVDDTKFYKGFQIEKDNSVELIEDLFNYTNLRYSNPFIYLDKNWEQKEKKVKSFWFGENTELCGELTVTPILTRNIAYDDFLQAYYILDEFFAKDSIRREEFEKNKVRNYFNFDNK